MYWRGLWLIAACGLASGCLVSFDGYRGGLEAGGSSGDAASGGKSSTGGKASGGKSSSGSDSGGDAGDAPIEGGESGSGGTPTQGGSAGAMTGGTPSGGSAGSGGSGGGGSGGSSGGGGNGGSGGNEPTTCPTNLEGPALVEVPKAGGGFYCMDRTEVPNEDYAVFLGSNPSTANQGAACNWNSSYQPDTGNCPTAASAAYDPDARPRVPVSCIDWCDARAYCAWAGKRLCGKIGGGTNPPASYIDANSSQWFRACSNGGTQKFPYGDTYQGSACYGVDSPLIHPGSVATAANCDDDYGITDLSGNVAEWEDSCSGNAAASDDCLIRGGSLENADTTVPSLLCNSSTINDATPSSVSATRNTLDEYIGFRCCLDP